MSHRQPKLKMSRVIGVFLIFMQTFSAWWSDVFTADIYYLPWSWRFSLISLFSWFFSEGESYEKAAKLRERKTSSYFVLESHLHADARIRIWPSGSDWLIVYHYFSHIFCLTYITWLFFVLVKRRPREISFFSYQHGLQYSSWRGGFTSFRFI